MTMFGGVLGCFFGILVIVVGVICLFVYGCGRAIEQVGEQAAKQEQEAKAAPRAEAGKQAAVVAGISVAVEKVEVGKITWTAFGDNKASRDDFLVVSLRISITDKTKKFNYQSWRNTFDLPRCVDNFGNRYVRSRDGTFERIDGGVSYESVTSDSPARDLVIFEKPLKAVEFIDLDLPGDGVGLKSSDVFRFRIPKEMWEKSPPKKK